MPVLERVRAAEGDLVALAWPPGPAWADVVEEAWATGVAVVPIDHRLPAAQGAALLERVLPTIRLDDAGARRVDGDPVEPGIVLVMPSSGTGDEPKLAEFDRAAIEAAVTSSSRALGATTADRWLCCLPLAHVGGLLVLFRAMLLGAPVAVHERFDPDAVLDEPGVAFTSLVPTMLGRLVATGRDLSPFRSILIGGAHLPSDLRTRAERAGARLVETYGMTETCGGVVYDGVPLEGTDARIGPEGEVQLRGPTMMRGYRFEPRTPFTPDGWLRTADGGEIDPDGRLHVVGRLDELIITGGEKVWPDGVEAVLRDHPGVREVAAAGRPDPDWGQRVAVWVVPTDPGAPPTLDELRAFAAQTLPRYAAPREVLLVDRLPRTPSGKVMRAALHRD